MALLQLKQISISFGANNLLDKVDFQMDVGERIGLIGRNGEGKSTLLKIIAGDCKPDSGETWLKPSLKVAVVDQSPNLTGATTIYDAVAEGLGEIGQWITEFHALSERVDTHDAQQ